MFRGFSIFGSIQHCVGWLLSKWVTWLFCLWVYWMMLIILSWPQNSTSLFLWRLFLLVKKGHTVVANKNPKTLIIKLFTWLANDTDRPTSVIFFFYRGLNKQGYKCRRKCTKMFEFLCYIYIENVYLTLNRNVLFFLKRYLMASVQEIITSWSTEKVQKNFYLCFLSECNAAIHKKCIDKIIGRCTGTAANSRDTVVCITYLCSTMFVPWTVLHIS